MRRKAEGAGHNSRGRSFLTIYIRRYLLFQSTETMKPFIKAVVLLLLFIKALGDVGLRGSGRKELEQNESGARHADIVQEDKKPKIEQKHRHVAASSSRHTVLIIRVSAVSGPSPTVATSDLYQAVFSDEISLKHQFAECSAGQVQLEPTAYGVLDVEIDARSFNSRRNMVDATDLAAVGYLPTNVSSVWQAADYIMLVLPQGVTKSISWAEIGPEAKLSIFEDTFAMSSSALVHQFARNVNWNSDYVGDAIADTTTTTEKTSLQDSLTICSSATANHLDLDWYTSSDGLLDLDLPSAPVLVRVTSFSRYANYQERSLAEYTSVKIGSLYLQYSRINDYNELTIVQDDLVYGTTLRAVLDTSASNHAYQGSDIAIEVCGVEQRHGLDLMVISIGKTRTNCNDNLPNQQASIQSGSGDVNEQQWSVRSNWSSQNNRNGQSSAKNSWPWNTWTQSNKNSQWKSNRWNQNNQSTKNSNWAQNSWKSNSSNQSNKSSQWKTNWSNRNNQNNKNNQWTKNSWTPSWNPTIWWNDNTQRNKNDQSSKHPGSWRNSNQNGKTAYYPGQLNKREVGLLLSEGLTARIIARQYRPVTYDLGGQSSARFHEAADAGATYRDNRPGNEGGWIYVSNSEAFPGGVGAITFDRYGRVKNYKMILSNTRANCGGGQTPWGGWISCEEYSDGRIWQTDPTGGRKADPITMGNTLRGRFESFAYDVRNRRLPRFFVTKDEQYGELRRFTPTNPDWNNPWSMLYGKGKLEYLKLIPTTGKGSWGRFEWVSDPSVGKQSAYSYFPNAEGMDVRGNELFFVSKVLKRLFVLNLDRGTYTSMTTTSGLFEGEPDQVQRITSSNREMLYFTEDGGQRAGVHGRNNQGKYFTILESQSYSDEETTGLAFSPDGKHMYVALQKNGLLFDVTRQDGLSFDAQVLNIKYH